VLGAAERGRAEHEEARLAERGLPFEQRELERPVAHRRGDRAQAPREPRHGGGRLGPRERQDGGLTPRGGERSTEPRRRNRGRAARERRHRVGDQ
jgi:hypothetical protein